MVDISVVIPTYNRSALLRRTVPALLEQVVDLFTYEVIFVSNGSTDDSPQFLTEMAAKHPTLLRFFHIAPTGGPAAPRNVGIREAKGSAIIILDDDVLPDPDLVRRHAEFHHAHPDANQAALGEVYVPHELLRDPISLFHTFPYDEVRERDPLSYLHFWTCNVSFKRQFMLDAGGFDERFLYFEDIVCGYRLEKHGMDLHFLPSARGQHLHQLKASGIPAKGWFTGVWLHAIEQQIPDPAIQERFWVVSRKLGTKQFLSRLVHRTAARVLFNRATLAGMRPIVSACKTRSRFTDVYYSRLFQYNIIAGYQHAKREARYKDLAVAAQEPRWADRGE